MNCVIFLIICSLVFFSTVFYYALPYLFFTVIVVMWGEAVPLCSPCNNNVRILKHNNYDYFQIVNL